MSDRKSIRAKILELVATVVAIGAERVHAGRSAGRVDVRNLQKGPHAWCYFVGESIKPLAKGTSGRPQLRTAEFVVEIFAIPPAVEPEAAPVPAALEDLLDDLSEAAKAAIEADVYLDGECQLSEVQQVEIDLDTSTDSDIGGAKITVAAQYITVEGE